VTNLGALRWPSGEHDAAVCRLAEAMREPLTLEAARRIANA